MHLTGRQSRISFSVAPVHVEPFSRHEKLIQAFVSGWHGQTLFVHVLSFIPMRAFKQARINEFIRATLFCYLEMHLINCQSSISFSVAPVHAEPFPRMRSGYKPSSPGGMDKLCLSMFYHSYQCVHSSKHG